MGVARVAASLILVLVAGCATAGRQAGALGRSTAPVYSLDQRVSWILRLEAQRWLADPATPGANLRLLVTDADRFIRRRAALAVGRIGDPAGVAVLTPLLVDTDAEVRATAAFALGVLGDATGEDGLRTALADPDVRVRGSAAEGLGLMAARAGGSREAWIPAATAVADAFAGCGPLMATLGPAANDDASVQSDDIEACRLALFALVRLRHFDALARLALGTDGQPVSQWWPVAFALQRIGDPRATPALESLLAGSGVYTTAFAFRGLMSQPRVLPVAQRMATDDTADARVRVAAIRALGRPDVPEAADTLLTVLGTRGLSAALTLETMAALAATGDRRAFDVLVDRFTDRRPSIRAAAMTAAARLDGEAFVWVISSLPPDAEWSVRAALATALGGLEPDKVRAALVELVADPDQRVSGPALSALAKIGAPDLASRLFAALAAPDFAVRATAAGLVGEIAPEGAMTALIAAYDRGLSDATVEARAAALAAAHAIGGPEADALVTRALQDQDWAVRLRAAQLSGRLADVVRPAPLRQSPDFFESAALIRPRFSPLAILETRYGAIEIELDVVRAPLTTASFMALTRAGFYNGLRWHRVIPNFVAQTGDPRGDGMGGPGFAIVDELSPSPFVRGTVGMALSWADTGGSQFFITTSPQPHLDGLYTVFGRVVKGMEIVDRLGPDDLIERMRIWDGIELK